jgi:molybdate transport system ATP-binding protein
MAFQVPIDLLRVAREADVEDVPVLIAKGIQVFGAVAFVERIVAGQLLVAEHLPFDPECAEAEIVIRRVVERTHVGVLDGTADEADEAPDSRFPIGPDRIERLSHVGSIMG